MRILQRLALKFYLFADDTNILFAEKKLKIIETEVNTELCKLYDWLTSNKSILNISKSNFLQNFILNNITLITNLKYVYLTTRKMDMLRLNQRNILNILAFSLIKTSPGNIILILSLQKSAKRLAYLRNSDIFPTQILLKINQSLIYLYITYGLASWGPRQAVKTHLNKIPLLQYYICYLRIKNFSDRFDQAIPLFIYANVLPLNFLYYQTISNLMHDVHNNKVPSAILNLFQKTSSCHSYNTRASALGNFHVNSSDLELYKLSFSRFGAKLWNEIPCNI